MKKNLFLLFIFLLTLTSCDLERTENHDIRINVGESHHLDMTNFKMDLPPDDFVALCERGRIMGMHVGYTEMEITTGHTTHFYQIYVEPRTTLYSDMKFLLGQSKEAIFNQYGRSIDRDGDAYLFGPLTPRSPEICNAFIFNKFNRVEACYIAFSPRNDRVIFDYLSERYEKLKEDRYSITYGDYYEPHLCSMYVVYNFSTNPLRIFYYTREFYEKL